MPEQQLKSLWGKEVLTDQGSETQEVRKQRARIGTLLKFNDILVRETETRLPIQSGATQAMQACSYYQKNHALITGVEGWEEKFKALGFKELTTTRIGEQSRQYHLMGKKKQTTLTVQVTESGTWNVVGKSPVIRARSEASKTLAHQIAFWMVAVDRADADRIRKQVDRIKANTTEPQREARLTREEERAKPVRMTTDQNPEREWAQPKQWDEQDIQTIQGETKTRTEELGFDSHLRYGTSSGKMVEKVNKNQSDQRSFREDVEEGRKGGVVTRYTSGTTAKRTENRKSQLKSPSRSMSVFSNYKTQPSPKKRKEWEARMEKERRFTESGGTYRTDLKEAALVWAYNKVFFADHQACTRKEHQVTSGLYDVNMTGATWDLAMDRAKIRDSVTNMLSATGEKEILKLAANHKEMVRKYLTKKSQKTDRVRALRGKERVDDGHAERDAKRDTMVLTAYEDAIRRDVEDQRGPGVVCFRHLDREVERSLSSLVRAEYDEKDYPIYGEEHESMERRAKEGEDSDTNEDQKKKEEAQRLRNELVGTWLRTDTREPEKHQRVEHSPENQTASGLGMRTRSMTGTMVESRLGSRTEEHGRATFTPERGQKSGKRTRNDSDGGEDDDEAARRRRKKTKRDGPEQTKFGGDTAVSQKIQDESRSSRSNKTGGKEPMSADKKKQRKREQEERRKQSRRNRPRGETTGSDNSESDGYLTDSTSDRGWNEPGHRSRSRERREPRRRDRSLSPGYAGSRGHHVHGRGHVKRRRSKEWGRTDSFGYGNTVPGRDAVPKEVYQKWVSGPVVDVRNLKQYKGPALQGQPPWRTNEPRAQQQYLGRRGQPNAIEQTHQMGPQRHGGVRAAPRGGQGGRQTNPRFSSRRVPEQQGRGKVWEQWWVQPVQDDIDTKRFDDMEPGQIIAKRGDDWTEMKAELSGANTGTEAYRITIHMREWAKLVADQDRDDKQMREEFSVAFEAEHRWGMELLKRAARILNAGITQKDSRPGTTAMYMSDHARELSGPWMRLIRWLAEDCETDAEGKKGRETEVHGRKPPITEMKHLQFMSEWTKEDMEKIYAPLEKMSHVAPTFLAATGLDRDQKVVRVMVKAQIQKKEEQTNKDKEGTGKAKDNSP
jgi:hypothetical protein